MFRFFLFMACVMATGASAAGGVSPCANTVSIQIMTPGHGASDVKRSAAEIPDAFPHFRAFVAAVTERVNAQLAKNKLCVKSAESTDNMESAEFNYRSLLQFVQWPLFMPYKYIVPALPSTGWHGPPFCRIYSPWIDLVVERKPVPRIFGIVRWNERQLLADQAVLDGAKNVPPGVVMPLSSSELGHFTSEYRKSAAKPVEERVPPDILWLFLRTWPYGIKVSGFPGEESASMYRAVEKGAEGYTKLVLALVDRCFAPSASGKSLHYTNILDAADLIPLEQYKIDMPIRHRPR